jgi:hypothetical protein
MTPPRKPLPRLGEELRVQLLRLRGLDADLKPINLTPEERQAMSDTPNTEAAPVAQPAAGAILQQPHLQALTAVGVLAAAAIAASESGVLPPWVASAGHAVVAVLAVFGIASPGIRKKA